MKPKKQPSPLVEAAIALEEELGRMGALSREARRLPLDSERNLQRAASRMAELASVDERLQPLVGALMGAVQSLVATQQEHATALTERAAELQRRREVLQHLQGMYATLAQGAQQLNALVQAYAATRQGETDGPAGEAPTLEILLDAMDKVIASAAQVMEAARQENFQDIARQADSLRQQIASARGKLSRFTPPR